MTQAAATCKRGQEAGRQPGAPDSFSCARVLQYSRRPFSGGRLDSGTTAGSAAPAPLAVCAPPSPPQRDPAKTPPYPSGDGVTGTHSEATASLAALRTPAVGHPSDAQQRRSFALPHLWRRRFARPWSPSAAAAGDQPDLIGASLTRISQNGQPNDAGR
jgi:hypothetical protein